MNEISTTGPEKKTIEEQMGDLLTALEEVETDEDLTEALKANAEAIQVLAIDCKKTDLFKRAQERFIDLKVSLEADHPADELLLRSWIHLLERISEAPTKIHMIGAVILCIPLVSSYVTNPEVQ